MTALTTPTATSPPRGAPPGLRRTAGATLLAGCIAMAVGAACWAASGVDFDTALEQGRSLELLADVAASQQLLAAGFVSWLCAPMLFAAAGAALSRLHHDDVAGVVAGALLRFGAAVACVAFALFLTMTSAVAPLHDRTPESLAVALNFLTSRLDWIATIAIIGLPPALLSHANRATWPAWLVRWGYAGVLTSALTVTAMVTGVGLATFGFAIVPVGIVWAFVVAVRLLRSEGDWR